jgi:hypothetical protein
MTNDNMTMTSDNWIAEKDSLTFSSWRLCSLCATTVIDKCFYQSWKRSDGKGMDHVTAKTHIARNQDGDSRNN